MTARINHLPRDDAARRRHLDKLVATYAPLGRRQRKAQRRKRIAVLSTLLVCIATAAAMLVMDIPFAPVWKTDEQRFAEFRDMLTEELNAITAERRELERYKLMIDEQRAALSAQLDAVNAKWSELDAQRLKYEEQTAMLAAAIGNMDAEQRDLEHRDPDSMLDEEISAISAQRRALEERWKQFEAQGELLATEIIAVNAQRRELEAQRRLMKEQQTKLQALIDRAVDNDDRTRAARSAGAETDSNGENPPPEPEQIAYAAPPVGDGELGEMRGGISMGGGLEVALGVTHSGSINGVEQYSNSFVIDELNSDLNAIDMSNMHSTLIQNGDGNFVAPNVLDAMANGFTTTIQNTLDDQTISTTSIYDISISNTDAALQGLAASQALNQSLDMSH